MSLPIYDRYMGISATTSGFPRFSERAKRWLKLLFVPGRVVQVPELNEMQSTLIDNTRQGFNVLFADGAIIKGLEVIPSETVPTQCTVRSGQILSLIHI